MARIIGGKRLVVGVGISLAAFYPILIAAQLSPPIYTAEELQGAKRVSKIHSDLSDWVGAGAESENCKGDFILIWFDFIPYSCEEDWGRSWRKSTWRRTPG